MVLFTRAISADKRSISGLMDGVSLAALTALDAHMGLFGLLLQAAPIIAPGRFGASEIVHICRDGSIGRAIGVISSAFLQQGLGYFRLLAHICGMVTLVRTTNPVRLSFLRALLADSGIPSEVFDGNISALEAGIGAFPRRLAVSTAQRLAAETVLRDAEEYYDD